MFSSWQGLPFVEAAKRVFAAGIVLVALPVGASALPLASGNDDAARSGLTARGTPLVPQHNLLEAKPLVPTVDGADATDGVDLLRRLPTSATDVQARSSARDPGQVDGTTGPTVPSLDTRDQALVEVLRSIATVDNSVVGKGRRRGDDVGGIGLSNIVLDNETTAELLRKVIDIKSTDGRVTVFSVVGLGDFVLQITPGDHTWTIQELSTGWSLPLSTSSDNVAPSAGAADQAAYPGDADNNADAAPQKAAGLFRVIRWLREFVTSSAGILCLLMASLFVLLWGVARTLVALERRSVGRRGL